MTIKPNKNRYKIDKSHKQIQRKHVKENISARGCDVQKQNNRLMNRKVNKNKINKYKEENNRKQRPEDKRRTPKEITGEINKN